MRNRTNIAGRRFAICLAFVMLTGIVAADALPTVEGAGKLQIQFAHECLDSLDGRDWLLVDAINQPVIEQVARERNIDLTFVPMVGHAADSEPWRKAVKEFGTEKLEAAAELGPLVFIRSWMRSSPEEAVRRLALLVLPDLWADAGLCTLPNGIVFLGASDCEAAASNLEERLSRHERLWDRVAEDWIIPFAGQASHNETLRWLRRQVGWVANELGVLHIKAGEEEKALGIFTRARALDPQNVSALLNRASCVKQRIRPELAETIAQELDGLRENLPDGRILWNLTQIFGTVVRPDDFLPLGWLWVLSGVSAADTTVWQEVLEQLAEEYREPLLQQLQASHAGQTGLTGADLQLVEGLEEPEQRVEKLVMVARRAATRGRTDNAMFWLGKAAEAGASADSITIERATVLNIGGKNSEAVDILEKATKEQPEKVAFWSMLLTLQAELGNAEGLELALERLDTHENADLFFEKLVGRARLMVLLGKPGQARELLQQAIESRPDHAILYDLILPLDYKMADKRAAGKHAEKLLEMLPEHAFGNYIRGSLLMEKKDYPGAESFFRRSIATTPSLHALNDLAVLLIETKRHPEAEQIARAALRYNERLAAPWDTLASALEAQGRSDEAFEAMKKALTGEGADDVRIQLHWAEMLFRRDAHEEAQEVAQQVHERRMELSSQERDSLQRLRDELRRTMKKERPSKREK